MSEVIYKFKRHESFSIREGWIEKAMIAIKNSDGENVFGKNKGVRILGIGSNMVKSLNYWMLATGLIQNTNKKSLELSYRGNILFENDPYLETSFSWCLIHYWLVSSPSEFPVGYMFFNGVDGKYSTKDNLAEFAQQYFSSKGISVNQSYLENDLSVLFRSYAGEEKKTLLPEDNIECPLCKLGLIARKNSDEFEKTMPKINVLDFRIVFYLILELLQEKSSFSIDQIMEVENGPCKLFNLNRSQFLLYLDMMNKHGYISISRTAGLNIVNIEKTFSLEELFKDYIGAQNVQ